MTICGIKITHDGGIAILQNGELKCSIEIEKLDNNPRYSSIGNMDSVTSILKHEGFEIDDIDCFVVDGWHGDGLFSTGEAKIPVKSNGKDILLHAAPYHEENLTDSIIKRFLYEGQLTIGNKDIAYSSYSHVAGHVMSCYSTSPAAAQGESAFVFTWDGGQYPRLYYFDAIKKSIQNLGPVFFFLGTVYSIFSQYFGPYKKTQSQLDNERKLKDLEGFFGGYSVAGKIMSYIALGKVRPELLSLFTKIYNSKRIVSDGYEHVFSSEVKKALGNRYEDADVLSSFHVFLEQLLLTNLENRVKQFPTFRKNLCYSGGCALNIKWNSALLHSRIFDYIWIPPFPNDSGSAIGMACCEWFNQTGNASIKWSVYSGPAIIKNDLAKGWSAQDCTIEKLALLIHETAEPILLLDGRAELGPRALGNRSILAAASVPNMKDILNRIKKREFFRPVAPICLEEHVEDIFEPGYSNPFMLFEHRVKSTWVKKIPSIAHLDLTARVQSVNSEQNRIIYELLQAYYRISGIPLLCNTSANLNGSGFFPDILSATNWGRVNYIWCDNTLFSKDEKVDLK